MCWLFTLFSTPALTNIFGHEQSLHKELTDGNTGHDECTQKVLEWPVCFGSNLGFVVWPGSQILPILTLICRACCSFRHTSAPLVSVAKPCCVLIQVHRPGKRTGGYTVNTQTHTRAHTHVRTHTFKHSFGRGRPDRWKDSREQGGSGN